MKIFGFTIGEENNSNDDSQVEKKNTEDIEKELDTSISDNQGFFSNIFDYGKSITSNISESLTDNLNHITQKSTEIYDDSINFFSEKSLAISESTKENFVTIKTVVGKSYEQIEIKNNLYLALSKIDIPFVISNLKNVKTSNQKTRNSILAIIAFLNIFQNHKLKLLSTDNNQNLLEKKEIDNSVTNFLKDIDMKDVLTEVKPFLLLIPPPYGIGAYYVLELFI